MLTGFYAGILALVFVSLSFNVILRRVKGKTLFGDGGDATMTRAVRAHGNFAEYVPLVLLMLFLYEYGGGSRYLIHGLGITLIIGRALHVFGLMKANIYGRVGGTVLTQLLLVMLAVMLMVKGINYISVMAGPPPI